MFGGDDFTSRAPALTRTDRVAAAALRIPAAAAHTVPRDFYEATTGIDGCTATRVPKPQCR